MPLKKRGNVVSLSAYRAAKGKRYATRRAVERAACIAINGPTGIVTLTCLYDKRDAYDVIEIQPTPEADYLLISSVGVAFSKEAVDHLIAALQATRKKLR
jgi:hypothetical protein